MSRQIYSTFEKGKLAIKYHATVADEIECTHKCYGWCVLDFYRLAGSFLSRKGGMERVPFVLN
jgi:hypothetical protein